MRKILTILKMIILIPVRIFSKISPLSLVLNSKIDKTSVVTRVCRVYNCVVGRYTYIGGNTIMINTVLGNFCSVSEQCSIGLGEHPLNMLSTSPVFYSAKNILRKCFNVLNYQEYKPVIIGNDVLIGMRSFVKGGVKIGNGAVVGMGSVVTKDVEPYTIVAGCPAKVIRKRFDDDIIKKLLETKWWDFSDEMLQEYAQYFNNPADLIDRVIK